MKKALRTINRIVLDLYLGPVTVFAREANASSDEGKDEEV